LPDSSRCDDNNLLTTFSSDFTQLSGFEECNRDLDVRRYRAAKQVNERELSAASLVC
jgi:hypothetical protein